MYGKCECFVMQMLYVCVLRAACAAFNAAFCMTCSLLMLAEDERPYIQCPIQQGHRKSCNSCFVTFLDVLSYN